MESVTDKIERYLSNEMAKAEKAEFEKEMISNDALKNEVDLQLKTNNLLEANAWINTKEQVQLLNTASTKKSPNTFLKVAAILVVLLIPSYFLIQNNYSDNSLYSSYYAPYPDRITTMGDNEKELENIMKLYNTGNYEKALEKLEDIETTDPLIILYKSLCYSETNQLEEAIQVLEKNRNKNTSYQSVADWYLILFYVSNGQENDAKNLLDNFLLYNDGYQIESAIKLNNDLNSFWRN